MAFADTAKLAVQLNLSGNFNQGISTAERSLSGLNASTTAGIGKTGILASAMGVTQRAATGLGGALSHARGVVGGLLGSLGPLAGVPGILGVGLAFKSTISNAKDFEQAMELIRTQAGGTEAEVDMMRGALLKLSTSVATTPQELAAGLYHIESAGIRGAQALDVLTTAAEGAKVGNADLESVTNALVASVNSGIAGTKSMGESMGVLNAIVGAGNMRMQDLTDAFSTGILSSAKAFGISIQSVGAAIADMTNQGVPAIDAATRLRMTISLLGAPSSKAAKELAGIGLNSSDLANAMRGPGGILDAVAMLKDHLDASGLSATQQAQLISNAFGGGRSSSAILTLLGSLDKFRVIQDQVVKGTGAFGDAWAATQKESDFAFAKFGAAWNALSITIGAKILPTITEFLGKLSDFISTNTDAIASGIGNVVQFASKAGSVIGGIIGNIAGMWNSIPEGLRDLLVKGIVADRTIKFLFGFSPIGAAFGGLESAIANAVGRGMGSSILGAGLGKMFVQPVFVTNMGMGGLGGADPLSTVVKGAVAGSLAGIVTLGAGIAGILAAYALPLMNPFHAAASSTGTSRVSQSALKAQPAQNLVGNAYSMVNSQLGPNGQIVPPGQTWKPGGPMVGYNAYRGYAGYNAQQDLNALIAPQIGHALARANFSAKTFSGSAKGAISEFPDLLRYLSGAQGAYGGKGSAGFLGGVAGELKTLQRLQKTATPEQSAKIADEIIILQGILQAKRFDLSPQGLTAIKSSTNTLAGKGRDDLVLPLNATKSAVDYAKVDISRKVDSTTSAIQTSQSAIVSAILGLAQAFHVQISVANVTKKAALKEAYGTGSTVNRGGMVAS